MPRRRRIRAAIGANRPLARGRVMRRRRPRRNARVGGYSGIEYKFKDDILTDEAFLTTWATKNPSSTNCLAAVEAGAGEKLRTGRKIFIKSLFVRGEIEVPFAKAATNPHETQQVRICLVLDTQTNNAEMAATDVMEASTKNYLSFRKLENTQRFKVLWDRTFTLGPLGMNEGATNAFARGGNKRVFKIMKTFKTSISVQYNATASPPTVAQITDNSFHIIGVANTTTVILSYATRIRFRD